MSPCFIFTNRPSKDQVQRNKIFQIMPDMASDWLDAYTEHGAEPLINLIENYLGEKLEMPWREVPNILYDIESHPTRRLSGIEQLKKIRQLKKEVVDDIYQAWAWHPGIGALEKSVESAIGEPLVLPWQEILWVIEELAGREHSLDSLDPDKDIVNQEHCPHEEQCKQEYKERVQPKKEVKPEPKPEPVQADSSDERLNKMQSQIDAMSAKVNKIFDILAKEFEERKEQCRNHPANNRRH